MTFGGPVTRLVSPDDGRAFGPFPFFFFFLGAVAVLKELASASFGTYRMVLVTYYRSKSSKKVKAIFSRVKTNRYFA